MRLHRLTGAALLLTGLAAATLFAAQPPAPASNPERRLDALERQVVKLLDEVKALRAERKGKAPAGPAVGEFRVYRFRYADAAELEKVLLKFFPDKGAPRLRLAAAPGNSLVVYAPSATHEEVEALLTKLDVADADRASAAAVSDLRIFRLKHVSAAQVEKILQKIFLEGSPGQMRVTTMSPASLIVFAPSKVLIDVQKLLIQLDVPEAGKREGPKKEKPPAPRQATAEAARRRLALAEAEAAQWRERVAWAERMAARGYLSAAQVRADRAREKAAEDALTKAQNEMQELKQKTAPK
jgi:type II secretory pathway component GspD/PulD (secretin)